MFLQKKIVSIAQTFVHIFYILAPSPPTDVKLVPSSSTCVKLSWHKPMFSNGKLTGYQVTYTLCYSQFLVYIFVFLSTQMYPS